MKSGPWLFGSNWKMYKTVSEATEYAEELGNRLEAMSLDGAQVFVIPPYTAIDAVRRAGRGRFWVGAQNMHWDKSGPYTGEISGPMLSELGVDLVEIGHAERRQYFNESDPDVNRKVHTALQFHLRPLICIGEELADKQFGVEKETVARQLRIALHGVAAELAGAVDHRVRTGVGHRRFWQHRRYRIHPRHRLGNSRRVELHVWSAARASHPASLRRKRIPSRRAGAAQFDWREWLICGPGRARSGWVCGSNSRLPGRNAAMKTDI